MSDSPQSSSSGRKDGKPRVDGQSGRVGKEGEEDPRSLTAHAPTLAADRKKPPIIKAVSQYTFILCSRIVVLVNADGS